MGRLFVKKQERRDELLSAYLDDELSAGERARLKAQLDADPALRAELDALRHTVSLVHDLPSVPVPRNFILSQTMAARPMPVQRPRSRRARAAPFLTTATAVVSLMFIVVMAGEMLLLGRGGLPAAPLAEQFAIEAPAALESASSAEDAADDVPIEIPVYEIVLESEGEAGNLGAMPTDAFESVEAPFATELVAADDEQGDAEAIRLVESPVSASGGGPAEATATAPLASLPSSTGEPSDYVLVASPTAIAAAPPATNPTVEPATTTSTPSPAMKLVSPTPGPVVVAEAVDTSAIPPTAPQAGLEIPESRGLVPPSPEAWSTVPFRAPISPWRVIEIILGLAALGLALAAVWARRARRQ